jgi:hypothetical protein
MEVIIFLYIIRQPVFLVEANRVLSRYEPNFEYNVKW